MAKKGPKSPGESKKMLLELRPMFESNKSADYAASKTSYARGTVQKVFKKWTDALLGEVNDDFIAAQKASKARGLMALQIHIGKLEAQLERLEKKLEKDGDTDKFLENIIKNLNKDIANLQQTKVMIEMKPTIDVTLEQYIDDIILKKKITSDTPGE